uniref:Uncharacterized protein n=1 Tax=Ammonifex degensii TaxID=42838 RepID=A0A7C2J0Y4_9THEO
MEKLLTAISDESTEKWSFQKLEALLWFLCLETFRWLMQEILLLLDRYLLATRERRRYKVKESQERSLTTLSLARSGSSGGTTWIQKQANTYTYWTNG